jgi:hypothetical protein
MGTIIFFSWPGAGSCDKKDTTVICSDPLVRAADRSLPRVQTFGRCGGRLRVLRGTVTARNHGSRPAGYSKTVQSSSSRRSTTHERQAGQATPSHCPVQNRYRTNIAGTTVSTNNSAYRATIPTVVAARAATGMARTYATLP